jgi:hypothetical protein
MKATTATTTIPGALRRRYSMVVPTASSTRRVYSKCIEARCHTRLEDPMHQGQPRSAWPYGITGNSQLSGQFIRSVMMPGAARPSCNPQEPYAMCPRSASIFWSVSILAARGPSSAPPGTSRSSSAAWRQCCSAAGASPTACARHAGRSQVLAAWWRGHERRPCCTDSAPVQLHRSR